VAIVPILLGDKEKVLEVCRDLHQKLVLACVRVRLDTGDERPGAKFYRWEMKGVPIRLEVGPRDIEKGSVTLARRDGVKKAVPLDDLLPAIAREANQLQASLYDKARQFMEDRIQEAASVKEAWEQAQQGVALVAWCGSEDCGHRLEEQVEANMLGEPQGFEAAEAPCAICGQKTVKRTYMARQY